ncbi:BPSS1780 family membrane protein [Azovibrio restrictus]|uniref:BPSS1780 family membrane protein n=1 Tax=Azovibrio restrictus TaxID=146938 RepID=UPI0026F225BB|nr:BPSS1780 family membrane protein [Azovibrio restrictus]MDD3482298.1 BPSS1780 family membrane protein [Azovibrio restrictus]
MQALKLPAARGWQWLVLGYALFRRQPALIGLMVMSYWMVLLLLNALPLIGPIAAILLTPGLSAGVMSACRNLDRGLPVSMGLFLQPLKENPQTQLGLGAFYLGYTMLAVAMTSVVDGGDLWQAVVSASPLDRQALQEGSLFQAILALSMFMVPAIIVYWYAPVLVAWHRLSLAKALFFSLVGCLRNWPAFLVYGLGLLAVGALLPGLVVGVLGGLFPGAASFFTSLITLPLLMILAPTMFASFYVSYREVFVMPEHISEHA